MLALQLIHVLVGISNLELKYSCGATHTTCNANFKNDVQDNIVSKDVGYKISECADYPCYSSCPYNTKCYGRNNTETIWLYLHGTTNYNDANDKITVKYVINSTATPNAPVVNSTNATFAKATEGVDFFGATGSVVFTGLQYEAAINVSVIADGVFEPDEMFALVITGVYCEFYTTGVKDDSISSPPLDSCSASVTGPPEIGYLVISDPGDAGVFQFSEASFSFPEAIGTGSSAAVGVASTATINVTRIGGTSGDVFVDYGVGQTRGAIEGPDYGNIEKRAAGVALTAPSFNSLVFLEGESEKSFTFDILSDSEFEYLNDQLDSSTDESIDLQLTNPQPCSTTSKGCTASSVAQPKVFDNGFWSNTGYADGTCAGTLRQTCIAKSMARVYIVDDGDAGVFDFTETKFYAREDAEYATVTITRTRGGKDAPGETGTSTSCCQDIYVHVGTISGTATAGSDFLSTGQAISGNIANPLLPTKLASSTCSGASSKWSQLKNADNCYATTSPESDQTDGVLGWPNYVSQLTVNIPLTNDALYEKTDESFTVYMHDVIGGAKIGAYNTTTVYILDDRDAGTFSFNSSVLQVKENAGFINVTVMRSGLPSAVNTYDSMDVAVKIQSKDGYSAKFKEIASCTNESTISPCLATVGQDYNALPSTTLNFSAGVKSRTVAVIIKNDNLFEAPDEMFQLELVDVTGGAYIAQDAAYPTSWYANSWYPKLEKTVTLKQNNVPSVIIRITDDGDPAVLFSRASVVCLENGFNDEYNVVLNSIPTHAVTVYVGGQEVSIPYGPVRSKLQFKISPTKLYFQPNTWNISQTFVVKPIDDDVDEDQNRYVLRHGVSSSDSNYHSGSTSGTPTTPVDIDTHFANIRYAASDTGVVFGLGIFDGDQSGLSDGSGIWDPLQGIMTAPKKPDVNVFVNDNDHAGVQILSDRSRFYRAGTESTVVIRNNGFSSLYHVWLRTRPTAAVTVHVMLESDSDIQVHPKRLIFSPLDNNLHLGGTRNTSWSTRQAFYVSAACGAPTAAPTASPTNATVNAAPTPTAAPTPSTCLESTSTFTIRHNCTSADINYHGSNVPIFPGPVTVIAYSEAGVKISKQDIDLVENGAADAYTVTLDAEPMHFERANSTAEPFRFHLYAVADTTVDSEIPTNTTYGRNKYLFVSTKRDLNPPHPSSLRNETPTKMIFLKFDLNSSTNSQRVVDRAGGGRMGSAYLRLYRLLGGDNGGAFGLGIAAAVVPHGLWPENDLSWNCINRARRTSCEDDIATRAESFFTATNLTNATLLEAYKVLRREENIVPTNVNLTHEINPTELVGAASIFPMNASLVYNSSSPSKGWVDLDITTAVNEHLLRGNTTFSLVVFSRSLVTPANNGLLKLTDEVAFASREYSDAALRPHIIFTPSGRVNVAVNKPAVTSLNGYHQTDQKSTDGMATFADPSSPTNIQYFALYTTYFTNSPWLHIDLEQQISVSSVVVWLRHQAPTEKMTEALFTTLISKKSLTLTGNLANAQKSALKYKQFQVTRPVNAPGGSTAVISKTWLIGQQGSSCTEVEARKLANNPTSSMRTDSVARYVMVYVEGSNTMPISEVEVYQEALTSVHIDAAAYLPSPSKLSEASQIELQPLADTLPQCESTLTFTAHDWSTPQVIAARARDNSVATGSMKAVITHSLQSSDPGFNSQAVFKPRATVSATITDDDHAGVTIIANNPSVVEGAHTYKGAETFFELVPYDVRVTGCEPGIMSDCNKAFDGDVNTAWKTEIEDTKDYSTATWLVVDTRADLYDAVVAAKSSDTSSGTSSEPTASPTKVPTIQLSARSHEAVQLHVYKPANLGTAGAKNIELRHSDTDATNPLSWALVDGSSNFDIPFGATWEPMNHTLSNFSSYMRYQAIICRQSFGSVGSKNLLELYEFAFSANTTVMYPKVRGMWDVVTTNLSRTHLEALPDSYSVVLDSEPLGEVVVTPKVEDNTTLTAWDSKNSSFNQKSRTRVVTGIYHSSIRSTRIATALTFNASTWHIPQVVQVFAVDDNIASGNRSWEITHGSTSGDKALTLQQQIATLYGFTAQSTLLPSYYQYDRTDKFHKPYDHNSVVPTTAPTSQPSGAPTGAPTDPHTVNGSTVVTVIPTPVPTTAPTSKPTPSPTNAPTAIQWLPNGAIMISVMEDDRVGLTLSLSSISVTEGGSTGSIDIVLDSQPMHPVTVTMVVPSNGTQLTVMPPQIVFDNTSWSVPQRVICTAVDDNIFEGRVPFTEAYTKLIPQKDSEFIMFNVTSRDAAYNNITVGGNEVRRVGGWLMEYAIKHRIDVTIYDDDSGCKPDGKGGEFQCLNLDQGLGGSCDGIKCICPKGYGGKNCELGCSALACDYTRTTMGMQCMKGSFCNENGDFNGTAFVESLGAAVNSEIGTSKRRLLDDTVALEPIVNPADVFYIVSVMETGCLFSTKEMCLEVAMDTVDTTGALTQLFKKMELEGKFVKEPFNVQFMQGSRTVDYANHLPRYVWSGIGTFLFFWILAMGYKMRHARKASKKRMSPDELDRYIKSQQIFS
jgi:hypothetical protein